MLIFFTKMKRMKRFLRFCLALYGSVLIAFYLTHCIADDDLDVVRGYKEIDGEAERNMKVLEQLSSIADASERTRARPVYLEDPKRVKRVAESHVVTDSPSCSLLDKVDTCVVLRYCCSKCEELLFEVWQEENPNPEEDPQIELWCSACEEFLLSMGALKSFEGEQN